MKIYLIEDNRGNYVGWDIYLGAVVVAKDSDDAKSIHPDGTDFVEWDGTGRRNYDWVDKLDEITVTEIGDANIDQPRGVVMSDYCAG